MRPFRASVRGVLAPRLYRHVRYRPHALPELLRQQRGSLGRRVRGAPPCRRAHPRREAGADRTASLAHRRLLGRMGADQAEDRSRVPAGADPRDAVRASAQRARPAVPARPHRLALSGRTGRLLPARSREPQAAGLGRDDEPPGAVRYRRRAPRAGRPLHGGRRGDARAGRRDPPAAQRRRAHRLHRDGGCDGRPHARLGRRHLRHPGRDHPPHRRRIPGERLRRRDDRDRRRDAAVPPRRGHARQDRQQRLGRLRVLLGPHHACHVGGRAGSAGRDNRHHGAAQQAA